MPSPGFGLLNQQGAPPGAGHPCHARPYPRPPAPAACALICTLRLQLRRGAALEAVNAPCCCRSCPTRGACTSRVVSEACMMLGAVAHDRGPGLELRPGGWVRVLLRSTRGGEVPPPSPPLLLRWIDPPVWAALGPGEPLAAGRGRPCDNCTAFPGKSIFSRGRDQGPAIHGQLPWPPGPCDSCRYAGSSPAPSAAPSPLSMRRQFLVERWFTLGGLLWGR